MICPKCKENKAHRSRRSGFKDLLASLALRIPYRCRACETRWYVFPYGQNLLSLRTPEERRVIKLRRTLRLQKMKRQLVGYGVSSLILIALLYYLFQQRMGGE
jgi:hypothetical protein